mgnify:CR=1 FL=1
MRKFKTVMLTLLLVISTGVVVSAKEIDSFSNFKITTSSARTRYLSKYNDSSFVINLQPSRKLNPIRIKTLLVNSNGDARSDVYFPTCGFRYEYSNWATATYIYALDMKREHIFDSAIYITGSWSPDSR